MLITLITNGDVIIIIICLDQKKFGFFQATTKNYHKFLCAANIWYNKHSGWPEIENYSQPLYAFEFCQNETTTNKKKREKTKSKWEQQNYRPLLDVSMQSTFTYFRENGNQFNILKIKWRMKQTTCEFFASTQKKIFHFT